MEKKNIYHDLEAITAEALDQAKQDGYNYNIILCNPNDKGEFDSSLGSTYEFVMDSYFEKSRPNAILLCKTKDLLEEKETERFIEHFSDTGRYAKMRKEMERLDTEMYVAQSTEKDNSKLKKGLSVVEAKADELHTNRVRLVWSESLIQTVTTNVIAGQERNSKNVAVNNFTYV